eukprot:SAG11_NODE_4566_length_1848_cov_34.763293_1_plen_90_part_00
MIFWIIWGGWVRTPQITTTLEGAASALYYLGDKTNGMNNVRRRAYSGEDSEIRRLALIEVLLGAACCHGCHSVNMMAASAIAESNAECQ